MSAFALAAEMGADAIELDVHLSADGQVVVLHNSTVDATTDGHGSVGRMTLRELRSLDAGGWFDAQYAGEHIPTLAEVFETFGRRLLVNVEIKVEHRVRPSSAHSPGQLEAEVVRLIQDHRVRQRVIVSSFSPTSLRRVHTLDPRIPLGFLHGVPSKPLSRLLRHVLRVWIVPYDALHPALGLVDTAYVAAAHRSNTPINVWTVDAAQDMRRVLALGADGIITNYPERLVPILAE
jgi:glycerophosphoryl diester phosphodiesterase